ncbi:MAG: xanthine dehydrogenase family protein molybdopterin-binding subunit [Acidimicrobiia bacterium]
MTLFGTPVRRIEDRKLLTEGGEYVADLDLPGAASVVYVTSPVAHGRILGVDLGDAAALPGVLAVVTAADLDVGPDAPVEGSYPPEMRRPLLAADVVRFVGEPVVAIVAETTTQGLDAAEQVFVDVDPLPAVVRVTDALADEVLLFPEAGTNVVSRAAGGTDEVDPGRCEVVVEATFDSARVAPCPIEGRAAAARWEPDGRLTHWSSCQGAHPVRDRLCEVHGLAPDRVRVIAPDVGGSFGAKARPYVEELLLPWLARRVGRAVRWVPPRSQDMVGLGHSRVQVQQVRIGGRRDGTIQALTVDVLADSGAYPISAPYMAVSTGRLSAGPYRIPAVRWTTTSAVTNTTPVVAYRGAGRPEATALLERAVDLFAAEVGLDPVEVRRRNLVAPEEFPFESATGLTYDSGTYEQALDAALAAVDYPALRAEQAARRAAGARRLLGVGVATFIDRTAGVGGTEYGGVELRPDGSLLARTGATPFGQGHATSWAMLVASRTGVPMERIEVVHGDTDRVPRGAVTGGSKTIQRAGSALAAATDELVGRARARVADLLEAAVDDVVLDLDRGGRFHVAGTPARSLTWADVAAAEPAGGEDPGRALACEADLGSGSTYPSGAYVAVVEVDVETGHVELVRLVTVDDAGRILNPMLAEGQVHGGAAQGVAQALLERFVYDEAGNPLTANFADYPVISAAELPSFESALLETPSPNNLLGAKGIAESGTIGAPPAVQNAVVDALAHLGVRHIDMPCTPERVWRALGGPGDAAA